MSKNVVERISLLDSLPVQDIEHFGRPLKCHLIGTHDLLVNWGCSEDVCLGGLFHSVYGTKTFDSVALAPVYRQRLRALIGEYAELLVYIFCMSDRKALLMCNQSAPYFWTNYLINERIELARKVLGDLIDIEAANYMEQLSFGSIRSNTVHRDMCTRFECAELLMSANARSAVQQAVDNNVQFFSTTEKVDE